ncbi:MAG TPA: type VII secretion-associated protein, partial [Mycobacterium sp.]|nr:type VII secretion-associated protein [Mycobacterium sp.]HQE15949.1 type VII secretion-associated protein [Mycobacterium sp.]
MAARDDPVVVEIDHGGVRVDRPGTKVPGPTPEPALVEAAMDWIDDPVGLLDGRPVPTATIWRELLAAAAGAHCSSLVVVHPDDWPHPRVKRLLSAAASVAAHAVVVTRDRWHPDSGHPRRGEGRLPRSAIWSACCAAALMTAAGLGLSSRDRHELPPDAPPVAESLVENRVAVLIPADWTVERRTTGPGSPRVRVVSPQDPGTALNITWSHAPGVSLAETAVSLRTAAAAEPAGVFDFAATAGKGSRPAVSYRETRPGRTVRWAVFIDGSTRIAVGCQSATGRGLTVLAPCLQAVRSAREAA